jgi:hypothetical protein
VSIDVIGKVIGTIAKVKPRYGYRIVGDISYVGMNGDIGPDELTCLGFLLKGRSIDGF